MIINDASGCTRYNMRKDVLGTYARGASLRGWFPPATLAHKEIIQQNSVNKANIDP